MTFSWVSVVVIAGVAVFATSFLAILLVIYDRIRKARYDASRNVAELNLMRRSTETRINELTERLLATESRWRDANHLLLDSQRYQESSPRSQIELTPFLRSAGVTEEDLTQDPKLIMVLMPFHPDFRETYDVIHSTAAGLGLRAVRGDEEYVSNDILGHVLRLIVKARIVIAVVDGRNPNVYYELGIAHALNKPTILVSGQSAHELPFDLQGRRVVLAEGLSDLKRLLGSEISRALV